MYAPADKFITSALAAQQSGNQAQAINDFSTALAMIRTGLARDSNPYSAQHWGAQEASVRAHLAALQPASSSASSSASSASSSSASSASSSSTTTRLLEQGVAEGVHANSLASRARVEDSAAWWGAISALEAAAATLLAGLEALPQASARHSEHTELCQALLSQAEAMKQQAVAAAAKASASSGASSECVVCLGERPRDTALVPCGHLFCAADSAASLAARSCPICRGVPSSSHKVFL
jgi:hypothetical protein